MVARARRALRNLFARSPAPGEWSAFQCLGHATDAEANVFGARTKAVLSGHGGPALRLENLELLATVGDADLHRTSRHAELGVFTLHSAHERVGRRMTACVSFKSSARWCSLHAGQRTVARFVDHDVDVRRKVTD